LSFYTKTKSEIKSACFSDMSMILLMYKKTYFNTNNLDSFIFSVAISLLQKFEDCIGQSNSDFNLILLHNFIPTNMIFYLTFGLSWHFARSFQIFFFYLELKFQNDWSFVRLSNKELKLLSIMFYVFFDKIHNGLSLIKGAINNIMLKYKHFIPRLVNILNELYKSCVFNKIDLKIDIILKY